MHYSYGVTRLPFSYSGDARNVGVFVDDTVRVNDRLSLNLGLRFDYNKAYSAEQDQVDEFGQPTGTTFPQTDFFTWKSWSPRVGFNWKLTADGRTALKGFWGRYHRPVATGEYANVIGPSIQPLYAGVDYDFTTGTFAELSFVEGNSNLGVSPDYKSPVTDQFTASFERELFRGFGTQLSYIYKRARDYPTWKDITGVYDRIPFTDDVGDDPTGRTFDIYQLVSDPEGRQFRIINGDTTGSDVHAMSFAILKRMSGNWQANASVTWLRGTGQVTESVSGVGISQRGGLQFREFGKNPNDFVNTDGRLRLDVTWSAKAQFLYKLPWDMLVSANFAYRNGAWTVRRSRVSSDVTNIPEGTFVFLQRRGENPRLDDVTQLDMRFQKDFRFGKDVRLGVFVDALNLLNEESPETVQSSLVTSPVFNYYSSPVFPRRFMLGAKFRF